VRTVADRIRKQGEDDVTKAEFMAWMNEWAKSSAGEAAIADAVWSGGIGPVLPNGARRTAGGSLNALVVPSTDPAANGVPNIVAREVQPIVDAAVTKLQDAGSVPAARPAAKK
jgi:hypothetical protein